ncbi:hypothetical protein [Natronorubrum daqingense]|uniref:Uncharacterized protein n=1 Tax=Natronorubrum daqingense TaxID=588898 RepID=A0A1N7DZG7_9EURY|nr:hypothetical protein [Natronorubrum daqingense]SIR81213.1 hypothetical protein SAMN05421809_2347 [Natronorubrum daqingense]
MKRALTALLTLAMIGSLMFMGFAGTAAAQEETDAVNNVEISQENNNAQVGISGAFAASDTTSADDPEPNCNGQCDSANDGPTDGVSATSSVDQTQNLAQGNSATVGDQTAVDIGDIDVGLGAEDPEEDENDNDENDNGENDNGENDNGENDNGENDNGENDNGENDNGENDNGENDNGDE